MKLVWGLYNKNKNQLQPPFVYDMFYLSIQMGKDLGYETVLYGTSDVIGKLGEYVDETHTIDDLDYTFFDDLKLHILSTRTDEYIILDGDVFLHERLKINKESILSIDTIILEQKEGYAKDCLDILNEFELNKIINEWNPVLKSSFSTGIFYWKGQNELLQYFLDSYNKLRKWYLENENILTNRNIEFHSNKSLSSHFIFEHLLYKIVQYHELKFNELDKSNSYYHWQGQDKFDNDDKIECVRLIVLNHKMFGGKIKDIYDLLTKQSLIKPILYV
jgi:hypothetical protein